MQELEKAMAWGQRYSREEVQKEAQKEVQKGGQGHRVISLPLNKAHTISEQLGDHRTIS